MTERWICPHCRRTAVGRYDSCSGSFTDTDHPSSVMPVLAGVEERDKSLAEEAGIDTTRCEFCGEPLDDSRPWRRGLDGCGAHESCLKAYR
jgi:hypothetical protein